MNKIDVLKYYFPISYKNRVKQLLKEVRGATKGKRVLYSDGKWGRIASTFHPCVKFFFVRTPKRQRGKVSLPYKEGYFNGKRDELIRILEREITGQAQRTKRHEEAIKQIMRCEIENMEALEQEWKEPWFIKGTMLGMVFKIYPPDKEC